jgi:crotonobetainyl-CoA:carnitine CoA-transferase CaiB-like acyl-CoA transferase
MFAMRAAAAYAAGSLMQGILAGIRVIDLTRNVAGPFCTMTLADLGADVIKIERPSTGDDTREWRPAWGGYSTTFLAFNRNKRSVAVDLDHPDGAEIIKRLVGSADVLVESFRPGSLAKRGLAPEVLQAINPRLVLCSISGFGARGPQQGRPGYDPVIQAYCGIMSITGEAHGMPVRTGPAVVDMGAGLWGALGVLAALFERQRTGVGRRVETSLLETGLGWLSYHIAGFLGSGMVPQRAGSQGIVAAPYETFQTADEYLFLAAPNDHLFVRLCRALDLPGVPDDPRFSSNPARLAHRAELHDVLEARFRSGSAAHWEQLLVAQEIPCSRIRSVSDLVADPQVAALGLLMPLSHSQVPNLQQVDLPVALDGQRAVRRDAPPDLGQHTEEVLHAVGYARAEIEGLRQAGVIGAPAAVEA